MCSYRAIICYLVYMQLCRTHLAIGGVDQLWKSRTWGSELFKHKSRIYLICSYKAIICYLRNMQLCRNLPGYRQCRPALLSSKQDSVRTGPEEMCCINTKQEFSDMLIQSYNMLSCIHVAVQNSPSYRWCRPALEEQDLRKCAV